MDDTHIKFKKWWKLCKENTIHFSPSDFDWYEEIENFIADPDGQLEAQEVIAGDIKD